MTRLHSRIDSENTEAETWRNPHQRQGGMPDDETLSFVAFKESRNPRASRI